MHRQSSSNTQLINIELVSPHKLKLKKESHPAAETLLLCNVRLQTMDQVYKSALNTGSSTAALVFLSAMDEAAVALPLAAPFGHDADSCSQPVPQFPRIEQRSGFPVHILITTVTELPSPSTATTVHSESLPITPLKIGLLIFVFLLFCWQHRGKACSLQYSNVTLLLVVNLADIASSSGIRRQWAELVQACALLRCYAA